MRIATEREGGAARLALEGRLDREWAERLSHALEDLLRDGVRSLQLDFERVTYVSSAATVVLSRWQQELAALRGDVRVTALSPEVREMFGIAGWDPAGSSEAARVSAMDARRSSWQSRSDLAAAGEYDVSTAEASATLSCRPMGDPARVAELPLQASDCTAVSLPADSFAVGLGAIGDDFAESQNRIGELIAVAGCLAHFPSDGARMADYLVGGGDPAPRALLGTGLVCQGGFSHMVRFRTRTEAEAVPFSELAGVALRAAGGSMAGLVVAAETAGLLGARLRRAPTSVPIRFDVPAVRDWLSFSPEPIYPRATALIAGVVARSAQAAVTAHLRPLGGMGRQVGHFHAAVFSYRPLPQRTVELGALTRGLFANHQLWDVLHLLRDARIDGVAAESTLVRGVAWIAPITQIT